MFTSPRHILARLDLPSPYRGQVSDAEPLFGNAGTYHSAVLTRAVAATGADRARWKRKELALFLAEQTGRRLGSIRQLRWEDFLYDRGLVY